MPKISHRRAQPLTHSAGEMFLLFAVFLAVALLLESEGLAHWAGGLEPGPLRTAAVPAASAIEQKLAPLHLAVVREGTLLNLARVGWSDDPALIARALPQPPATKTICATSAAVAGAPSGSALPLAVASPALTAAATAPLAALVPRVIQLPPPLPPVAAGKPRVVALAGDSMMAVGLSAQLLREAANDKNLRIVKAFRSGTGLARPEVFDWMQQYPAMIGAEKPDVVLVAIGANDGQGFVVDGKVLPYGSDRWRAVYQQRVDSYLSMLEASGAQVVWMGLPPMRIPVYNEKIDTLNRIAYTVVSQHPRAAWLNLGAVVGDGAGGFREFESTPAGKQLRLRASDGIHLSDEGAGLLTPQLLRWLDPPPAAPAAPAPPAGTTGKDAPAAAPQETVTPAPVKAAAKRSRKHRK
jgi:hypothetical protein